jgi:hypothetical protein
MILIAAATNQCPIMIVRDPALELVDDGPVPAACPDVELRNVAAGVIVGDCDASFSSPPVIGIAYQVAVSVEYVVLIFCVDVVAEYWVLAKDPPSPPWIRISAAVTISARVLEKV